MSTIPNSRLRAAACILCVLAALSLSQALSCSELPRYRGLTIVHTNDIHGHLFPFDYDALGKQETAVGGAARRAALIRQIKGASANPVMVMDAGDTFTRGPLADLKGVPDFAVMNAVPYDVMALGNNEFKGAAGLEGRRIMFDRIRQAQFPILSANVFDKATDKTIVPAYKVFDIDGMKVGVFGLTAQRVAGYSQAKGLEVRDPIVTARKVVRDLEDKADFIIALTHIGYAADLELAAAVPQIDVIIGGDSHTWLFEPTLVRAKKSGLPDWWVGGVVVCQAGEWGKAVGKLELSLRLAEGRRYKVMGYAGELIAVDSSVDLAKDVEHVIWRFAKPYYREVGTLDQPVPKAEAPAWVAERMREAAGVDVAVEPNAAIENGLPAGYVTRLDIRKMFPFVNEVVKLKVTGKQLRQLVAQIDCALAGASMTDGVLRVGDKPAEDTKTYTLAVENFYASTSPALAGTAPVALGRTIRDIVADYVNSRPKSE